MGVKILRILDRVNQSHNFQSVEGVTGCYSVVIDQFTAVLGHWVSTVWYWSVFGYIGSEQGDTGCQCDMLSESIWFTRSKASYHTIFEEGKSDDVQTDRISFCRLDPFCRRGRVKKSSFSAIFPRRERGEGRLQWR